MLLHASRGIYPGRAAHAFLEGYGVLLGICILYCLWVQFGVTGERRLLLAALAFGGISLGGFVHAVISALTHDPDSNVHVLAMRFAHSWSIAGYALLMAAAFTTRISSEQDYTRAGKRTIAGALVLSLCLLAVPLTVDPHWFHLRMVLPTAVQNSFASFLQIASSGRGIGLVTTAAALSALAAHARNYTRREDELSARLMPFLGVAVLAGAAQGVSSSAYDSAWWSAHALLAVGLMFLLTELGIQFGASYSDSQARIRHMEAVHYMSSRLTNTLDLRVVLLALVSDTASMLSAKFASVMLSDDSGETLTTEVTYGLPESPLRPRSPQHVEGEGRPAFFAGHTARAFREKRICVVDDVHTDVEFLPWRMLARHDGYAVSVPLVYHDLALGVLNLFFEKHVPLNDEKVKLFQTLASSASVSIVNAQLYDRTLNDESGDVPFSLRLVS